MNPLFAAGFFGLGLPELIVLAICAGVALLIIGAAAAVIVVVVVRSRKNPQSPRSSNDDGEATR